jgi:hypothetical protein
MKNLAMRRLPYGLATEAAATGADAAEAGAVGEGAAALPGALQGTALTGASPRNFWKPSTIT